MIPLTWGKDIIAKTSGTGTGNYIKAVLGKVIGGVECFRVSAGFIAVREQGTTETLNGLRRYFVAGT